MAMLAARTHGPHEELPRRGKGEAGRTRCTQKRGHPLGRNATGRAAASAGPERANAVRLARAELKRRVAEGGVSAAEVILSSPWEAESMSVSDLLTSQRRWGSTRCRKFLQCLRISENKPIGTLTERQRRALAQLLVRRRADVP